MGSIIGGVIGGVGSLIGGSQAAKQDLTGFNYLKKDDAINSAQGNVAPAQAAQTGALTQQNSAVGGENNIANTEQQLLTGGQQTPAFQNYLNSTGYNFQLQQGTQAVTQGAASKGLLNSGATAKALTQYGQNLASTGFNNYLGQLNNTASVYGNTAQNYGTNATGYDNQAALGINAAEAVGSAGTTGGTAAGAAQQSAISSGANQIGSSVGAAYNYLTG